MLIIQNKWIEKERNKKPKIKDEPANKAEASSGCHLNVSLASRLRTLRGVRK